MVEDGDFAFLDAKFNHCSLQQLVAARSSLTESLGKVSLLQSELTTSEKRLRDISHRLPVLKSMLGPLQDQISVTNCLTKLTDEAVERATAVLGIFKAVQVTEMNLEEDPQADLRKFIGVVCCFERYVQMLQESYEPSLNSLEEVVVFLKQTRALDNYGLQRLTGLLAESRRWDPRAELLKVDGPLHKALEKLDAEFRRLVVENSPPMDLNPFMIDESDSRSSVPELPFSPVVIGRLLVIMDRQKANGRLQGCIEIYREIRTRTVRKGMSSLAPIYLQYCSTADAVNRLQWEQIHEYIFLLVQHLKVIVKVLMANERELCRQVFQTLDPSEWGKCLGHIVQQSNVSSFFRFTEAVASSHHRPEALLIGLLDLFKGLEEVIEEACEVFAGEGCLETWVYFRESQMPLIHNTWRVFLELVKNVDTSQAQIPKNGGKDMNASFVVNYMGMMARDYGEVLEQILEAQAGGKQQQFSNLSTAVLRIMSSLEKNLEDRSTRYEDGVLAHVFLMNNYRHVLVRLEECVRLAECLGEEWSNEWQRKVDQNLSNYRRKGWERVLKQLNRDGLTSSSGSTSSSSMREMLRTKLRAFNTAFEGAYNKQCRWVILDDELRETTRTTVIQQLVPAYHSFLQSFGSTLEEGFGSRKSIKYTADMIQAMLGDLFEGSEPKSAERSF